MLSDNVFRTVINDMASQRDGAIVGKVVQDKALHADILALLGRIKPSNEFQAEQIARDAAANSQEQTQDTLFGPETTQQSLYGERAKVLDGAMKRLAGNRRLASLLVDREGAITSLTPTNQLDTEANQQEADRASRAQAYLQRQANVKGPISDALTQAARRIKDNPKQLGNAVTDFLKAVRQVADGAQPDRQQSGAPRQDVQPEGGDGGNAAPQGQPEAVSPEPQSERTPEGEQTLIPGVAPITDRDRLQAQTNRPLTGTDRGPGSGRDDLFGNPEDRQDLFDRPQQEAAPAAAAQAPAPELEPEAPRDPQRGKFDGTVTRSWKTFINMKGEFPGLAPDDLGGSARDYVVAQGRKARAEVLILMDDVGRVKAVGRGKRSSVGMPPIGGSGDLVAHHNHPRSSPLSADEIALMASGPLKVIYAHGHKGQSYRAEITPQGRVYLGGSFQAARSRIDRLTKPMLDRWQAALRARMLERANGGMQPKEAERITNKESVDASPWFQQTMLTALAKGGVIHYDARRPEPMTPAPDWLAPILQDFERDAISKIKESMPDADDRPAQPVRRTGDLEGFPVGNGTDTDRGYGPSRKDAGLRGDPAGQARPGDARDVQSGQRDGVTRDTFDAAGDELFGPETAPAPAPRDDFDAAGDELFGREDAPPLHRIHLRSLAAALCIA